MILTDKEKMVQTPTYYLSKMYVPFQDATFVPVTFDAGTYAEGAVSLPRVDAIAAKDTAGKVWLELTNLDPQKPVEIEIKSAKSARGETLTAPAIDSINTFDAPHTVAPWPIAGELRDGRLALTLAPKSVTVVSVEP